MFAFAIWDRAPGARCSWPATASARSPCTTRTRRRAGLRLGDERPAPGPGRAPRRRPRRPRTGTSYQYVPAPLAERSRRLRKLPRRTASRSRTARWSSGATGGSRSRRSAVRLHDELDETIESGSSRPASACACAATSRSGRSSPAASTPARWWPRWPAIATGEDLLGRLRRASSTRLRYARQVAARAYGPPPRVPDRGSGERPDPPCSRPGATASRLPTPRPCPTRARPASRGGT